MSSLKDWYRYVDSKARHRPEGHPPAEGERVADERSAGQPPAESGGEAASEPPALASEADAAVGEEALDVWSGLFPARRKPEPKPTTAPLRPPSEGSLDPVPADLPFTQAPIETPPAPQFHLPEAAAAIPSFDDFVSPFAPEPAAAPPPSAAAAGAPPLEAHAAPHPESQQQTTERPARAASLTTDEAPAPAPPPVAPAALSPEAAAPPMASPTVSAAAATVSPEPAPAPPMEAAATASGATEPASVSPPAAAPPPAADGPSQQAAAEPEPADDDQIRWRSPFPLPGPGRTVSSGAPGPRPEPTVPRVPSPTASVPEDQAATLRTQVAADTQRPTPNAQRPMPGSPEWERERVERLARTFRDTLRSLEQSLTVPRAEAPDTGHPPPDFGGGRKIGAGEELLRTVVEPPPAAAPEAPVEAPPASPILETAAAAPPPAEVIDAGAASVTSSVSPDDAGSLEPAAAVPDLAVAAPIEASVAPAAVEMPPAELSYAAGTPDVLRNIQEAALIRQRLPQHMEMLLRIPTNEVAQNSYKSPFRETREDLIGRLLDPQLTLEEAARILGVCPTTVRRYTNRNMLHCHRTPGNQRRFRMSDVLQFLEQFGDRIDRAAEAKQYEEAA